MPATLPAAVLWDMDGTLTDTEPYWQAAEARLAAQFGKEWTHADQLALVGMDLIDAAREVIAKTGMPLEPEEIVHRLLVDVVEQTRAAVPWRAGARELLAALQSAGVPCALVTMSWTSLAQAVIEQLPEGTFDVVVTGDIVTHGKPHPEPYLTAATMLGVSPSQCVAIEDSRTGVASARGAGVPTLGVENLQQLSPEPGLVITTTLAGLTPEDLVPLFEPHLVPGDLDRTRSGGING